MAALKLFPHPLTADYRRHEVLNYLFVVNFGKLRGLFLGPDVFA